MKREKEQYGFHYPEHSSDFHFQEDNLRVWAKSILAEVREGLTSLCGTYEYDDRDAVFTCTADTIFKLASGKLDPIFAFTTGKLRVEGNLEKAMKLQNFVKK